MPRAKIPKSTYEYIQPIVETICDIGRAYQEIRPGHKADWGVFAFRVFDIAVKVNQSIKRSAAKNPWSFIIENANTWVSLPLTARALTLDSIESAQLLPEYWDGQSNSSVLVEAMISGIRIRWIQDGQGGECELGPFVEIANQDKLLACIGERIWQTVGSRFALYAGGAIDVDPLSEERGVVTEQIEGLISRLQAFRSAGITHSCLLVGPPGAGKSTAIRQAVHTLGLSCLRINVRSVSEAPGGRVPDDLKLTLGTLVRMMRPDVVVLEDIDRAIGSVDLLETLETLRETSGLILASANGTRSMMGASLRPGRFDDVLVYDKVDARLISELSGDIPEIRDRLLELPLAYAYEYAKRVKALGLETANRELDELETRAETCSE